MSGSFILGEKSLVAPGTLTRVKVNTSTETIRLIRDGKKGEGGVEVGEGGEYIPVATLSPPE